MRAIVRPLLMAVLAMLAFTRIAGGAELPEFPHRAPADWVNSAPLTRAALRGHPVLVEFWTFECSNCLATVPWVRSIAGRYRERGLVVIGVHTPELPQEHDRSALRRAVARLGIDYPVMIDEDYRYWQALDNHYWPAFYLYDGGGQLVASSIGEQHPGVPRSEALVQRIAALLGPPAPPPAGARPLRARAP